MGQPSVSAAHTDAATALFKCSSCGHAMRDWLSGSVCHTCRAEDMTKAAAKPGIARPAAGAKKPAGNVQDEFPKCPTCGTPTKDGTKCEDCKTSTEREHKTGDLTVAEMEAQAREREADSKEEEERRGIRARARAAMARMLGLDDLAKAAYNAEGNPPLVLKASAAKRFSFAPMYMPGRMDAHGEFVKSGEDLQEAAWEYVRKSGADRTVFLQHIDKAAGEWVEITSWPYPVEAIMSVPNADGTSSVRKATLPAGTVYMGVVWQPWAWDLVQKGRLLGFSMGGWAKRVQAELAEDVTKAAALGEPWDQVGLVNPNSPAARRLLPPR